MFCSGARTLGIALLAILPSFRIQAQTGPLGKKDIGNPAAVDITTKYDTPTGTGVLVFHVFAENAGALLHGHVQLLLTNLANEIGLLQVIDGDQEGIFPNLQPGNYEIEASALGYTSVHRQSLVVAEAHVQPIEIVLHRDPLAPNLEVTDSVISPKARKEVKHAVAFLKEGYLPQAQKHLEEAYKLAPSSSDLNFLLGYLYFQERNYKQADIYLSAAAGLSPNSARALTLLGRTDLQLQNYPAARSALEQAVLADEDNWSTHDLLADAYLQQKHYDKARDEAQVAISKGEKLGKSTVSPAQLVLGQAYLGLGQKQQAIDAFNAFLRDSPQNPMAYQVHSLLSQLEKSNSSSVSTEGSKPPVIDSSRADPLDAVPGPELSKTQAWRPPDVDDIKPAITPAVTCDTARVLEESGKRVLQFVQDLSRFAADEDVFHQSLDAYGFPTHTEIRKYAYVALVSPDPASVVSVDENRSARVSQEGYPDGIASTGFITLAFVFHPELAKDFDFECEGQGEWHGQPSWVVHFRQRSDRANRMHSYKMGQIFPVDLKGRAWITADNFEIARIEADMVRPMPQIQLLSERQTVEYGPVPFLTKNTTLWLPKKVEIYFDFRKHHYYRRHSFDHYLLFSVDTDEKRKAPESKPTPPDVTE